MKLDEKGLEAAQKEWTSKGWRQFTVNRVKQVIKAYLTATQCEHIWGTHQKSPGGPYSARCIKCGFDGDNVRDYRKPLAGLCMGCGKQTLDLERHQCPKLQPAQAIESQIIEDSEGRL